MPPILLETPETQAAPTPPPTATTTPTPASTAPAKTPRLAYGDLFSNREFINLGGDDPYERAQAWKQVLSSYPEWKRTPSAKQSQMLIDLQRLRGEGLQIPPVPSVGDQVAKQRDLTHSSGKAGVFTGSDITGVPGQIVRQTSGLALSPFLLAEQLANSPYKSAVHFGKEYVAQPLREIGGRDQPGEKRKEADYDSERSFTSQAAETIGKRSAYTLFNFLGGDTPAAREAFSRGATGEGLAALLTVPLITAGAGKLLGGLTKEVAPTRMEGAAMHTISDGAIKGKGPADAAARVAEQQSVIKQVLAERGIKDSDLRKVFPSREFASQSDLVGNVARGNQLILDVAKDAVNFTHRPIDAVMSRYGKQPAGAVPSRIAKSLTAQATEIGKVNPALADSITELSKKVASARTFEELNDIKSHANKMLDSVYSPVPGKAIDATAERAYAYKLAADGIRQEMYPELQKLSGSSLDLAKLGRREGDAIALRDGIYKHYLSDVAPAQAGKDAASFLEYTLAGQGAPGHSYYSKHILARGLEKSGVVPSAGSELNSKFRRAAGPIGSGMTPEKVNVHPRSGPPPPPVSANTVQLGNGAPGLGGMTTRSITVNGKPAGHLTYDLSGNTATIHHVGAPTATYNAMSNTLGPSGISQMVQQLITAHPNVKYIQGIRVGGAQASAGRSVRVPVSKLLPSGKGGQLPPGISLTPYHAGRTARFPNAGKAAVAAGRASGTAQGLTPPPSKPAEDDENED